MRTKNQILFFLFFTVSSSIAQVNHVLNYSFENYTGCGIGNCTTIGVDNWYQPTIVGFNWCSHPCFGSSSTSGVPQNFAGYQYARTGQCYGVIQVADTVNEVDYLTGSLSDSLLINKKYCVTFYVSLCDSIWWAVSEIGAYLSSDSICNERFDNVLPYTPQIENPSSNFITDKINWIPISSEYVAHGGERFITIGGFRNTTLSDYDSVGNGGTTAGFQSEVQSAYYIDDVYVHELTIADAGREDSVCAGDSVRIGKDTTTTGVSFSWQPTVGLSNPNIAQPIAAPEFTTTYTLTVTNDSIHNCNCADSVTRDSVVISVCTGINELINKVSSKIYPDPNNGVFTLSLTKLYNIPIANENEIEIFDVFGRKVYKTKINSAITVINMGNKPQGMYFYKIHSSDGVSLASGKFVVE